MKYKDMTDNTILKVSYESRIKATRLHLNNMLPDLDYFNKVIAIDLDNDSVLKLINELNEIIENE